MKATCRKWPAGPATVAPRSPASSRISGPRTPSPARSRWREEAKKAASPDRLLSPPQRAQIEIEHGFLFLAVGTIELSKAHHLAHDLGVEALAFRFRIDFADVGGQRRLLFLQPLDALDQRAQMFLGEAGFGHSIDPQIMGARKLARGPRAPQRGRAR